MGLLSVAMSYAYMRPANPYRMYYGPEVKEERVQGAAYALPDRQFINSRYGEYIDNRQVEFSPGDDANRLFWSYSQP
ncbi:Hypothetical protein FNO222_1129 [Francisella orientalis]|uniref:Uncharacterized protein n=1 Tax=Francisella orientalis TaxID=299583 RepID=A0ABN4GZB9_9GAMM|nr:hypothetical protein [Francisella orientalis]AKN85739.1 hypothetical protein FNO12_1118 [Francisella orientalis FNO12]AKN87279.1 Hypothetical protein FNO24_1120 [Francisella orientalis FNO24]AHB98514.1 hypothetical protein M973_06275 [Francisella orientalis LADL 07-285A]AKN88816.1 Hypothetical protein FNO190_1118 [Francisella orientalis]AKU05574.1 Hypothetical protein FNO01_1118 [Francisella orientalis]